MHRIQRRDCGLEYRRGNYFTRHNLMKTAPEWHLLARPAAHDEDGFFVAKQELVIVYVSSRIWRGPEFLGKTQ